MIDQRGTGAAIGRRVNDCSGAAQLSIVDCALIVDAKFATPVRAVWYTRNRYMSQIYAILPANFFGKSTGTANFRENFYQNFPLFIDVRRPVWPAFRELRSKVSTGTVLPTVQRSWSGAVVESPSAPSYGTARSAHVHERKTEHNNNKSVFKFTVYNDACIHRRKTWWRRRRRRSWRRASDTIITCTTRTHRRQARDSRRYGAEIVVTTHARKSRRCRCHRYREITTQWCHNVYYYRVPRMNARDGINNMRVIYTL